ncbi:hypothetical protein HDA32_001996 [Spinactinospora alkalitolerans]|uniref:Uncharacterized protein n=1 Tax=Spinactinospora alkalitolerans TaxID=687207 RepID=A0A852TR57_9ACTN|nr:hypothetical protein [Spinactinospora alkalitolerans]NYE46876.1 hypothetical protein [Spinactinospora alkalitolerans]
MGRREQGIGYLSLEAPDGSWAEIEIEPAGGPYRVDQGGPRRLWDLVEDAHSWWTDAGKPDWSAFGVTVTPEDQHAWYETPDSAHRWSL